MLLSLLLTFHYYHHYHYHDNHCSYCWKLFHCKFKNIFCHVVFQVRSLFPNELNGDIHVRSFDCKYTTSLRSWIFIDNSCTPHHISMLSPIIWPSYCAIHYNDVTMIAMASQITNLTIFYSTVYTDADQRKQQSSASLAFVRGIHRWPVNSPHKGPVTRKCFHLMTSSWTRGQPIDYRLSISGNLIVLGHKFLTFEFHIHSRRDKNLLGNWVPPGTYIIEIPGTIRSKFCLNLTLKDFCEKTFPTRGHQRSMHWVKRINSSHAGFYNTMMDLINYSVITNYDIIRPFKMTDCRTALAGTVLAWRQMPAVELHKGAVKVSIKMATRRNQWASWGRWWREPVTLRPFDWLKEID